MYMYMYRYTCMKMIKNLKMRDISNLFLYFWFINFFLIQLISSEQCNSDGCFKRGKKKRHSWRVGVHEYACTTYAASATDRTWTEYIINVRARCISDHSVL